jgi:ABC-type antimicrobial peptide transport system permease subunit
VIPAIADIGVIQWSLHKKIGDYIDYPGANGITWKLKLVAGINNSVFQGNVIVSEKNFDKIFPEHRGYNVFLIDYCSQLKDPKVLMASLERYGISIETTTSRLLRYSAVQNTYLQVFLALGALGLLIGTFGVVIIILRNLLERQVELGWMSVAGFSRITIASMLFFENFATIVLAVLCAIPAIGIIVMPGLYASAAAVPWLELAIFFITLILLSGLIILITSFYAARKSLLQIIRND